MNLYPGTLSGIYIYPYNITKYIVYIKRKFLNICQVFEDLPTAIEFCRDYEI